MIRCWKNNTQNTAAKTPILWGFLISVDNLCKKAIPFNLTGFLNGCILITDKLLQAKTYENRQAIQNV